jgi:nicotinamide-nucleotide amidase
MSNSSQWLCRRLADLGHVVTRQVAVADTGDEIQQAVREALGRADLVITTGGLGPTTDDITRERIAELLGKKLIPNADICAHIENFFAAKGRPRPAGTRAETFVPEGALFFLNAMGTAPGLAMQVSPEECEKLQLGNGQARSARATKWLVMLPGPPRELRPMFDRQIVPLLKREFADEIFVCHTLRTSGIGESRVQEFVAPALQPLVECGLGIGYCARPGEVDVRLTASGAAAEKTVGNGIAVVQKILGANIYGLDDEEIEEVVVRLLTARKKTLALAESCTGGNLAHRVTNVPGASEIFLGGVVSYSNAAKQNLLGVRAATLAAHGAVSAEVAGEMAQGARDRFGADFALAVTGIAGPGGGTPEKPVGTVFIALASAAGVTAKQFLNVWDRATFKQVTTMQALEWLRQTAAA